MVFLLFAALPQDYMNLVMEGEYAEALQYCDDMITKGKKKYEWSLEKGDLYLNKFLDFHKAAQAYQNAVDTYKKNKSCIRAC